MTQSGASGLLQSELERTHGGDIGQQITYEL